MHFGECDSNSGFIAIQYRKYNYEDRKITGRAMSDSACHNFFLFFRNQPALVNIVGF